MKTFLLLTVALASSYLQAQDYKLEPTGAAPGDLAPSVSGLLAKQGHRILSPAGKPVMEVWLRADAPKAPPSTEENVSINTVPQGALMAVVRFPEKGQDRRGQTIKPGTYTMRYSQFPITGDHQGVAPQRDFFLITPVADDTNGAATPAFRELVAWSMKATGTPHPGVFSLWKPEAADFKPGLAKEGEHDWVLTAKIGDLPVSIILIGQADH